MSIERYIYLVSIAGLGSFSFKGAVDKRIVPSLIDFFCTLFGIFHHLLGFNRLDVEMMFVIGLNHFFIFLFHFLLHFVCPFLSRRWSGTAREKQACCSEKHKEEKNL